MSEKDLVRLIEDVSDSLHRDLDHFAGELRGAWHDAADRIENAVGRIENAVGRNSKMVPAGTLTVGALSRSVARHDRAIKDLQARMRVLERQRKRKKE